MKRRGPWLVLLVALALLGAGLVTLFRLRLGQGDLFPVYSSLRADPLGTRALHDGLAQLPGLRVERRLKPLAALEVTPPRTILLAGLTVAEWREFSVEDFNALDAAVRAGSRLVIALRAQAGDDEDVQAEQERRSQKQQKQQKKKKVREKSDSPREKVVLADLRRMWGVSLRERTLIGSEDGAQRVGDGPLPERVAWRSDLHFTAEQGVAWRTLYRRGGEPVLMERTLDRGSIVVAGDAFFLSNEALQRDRPTALLAWVVGPNRRVVFDESHLGVTVQPGIAALARRYGLAGAFFTLLLLAALFVWRRMALFVPPADEAREVALSYHPAAGLEALLRRAVAPGELAAACATEWKRTARPGDVARVEAALAAAPKNSSAATLNNAALKALRRR